MQVPGRVGVCMPVRAYSLVYPACNAHAPYCDVICGPSDSATFFDYLINGTIFEKKVIGPKMCLLILSTTFSKTFLILRRIKRDIVKNVETFPRKVPVILVEF